MIFGLYSLKVRFKSIILLIDFYYDNLKDISETKTKPSIPPAPEQFKMIHCRKNSKNNKNLVF